MHVESVGDHSRRKVRDSKATMYVVHTLTFSPKTPSDLHVMQNGGNDDQRWQQQYSLNVNHEFI